MMTTTAYLLLTTLTTGRQNAITLKTAYTAKLVGSGPPERTDNSGPRTTIFLAKKTRDKKRSDTTRKGKRSTPKPDEAKELMCDFDKLCGPSPELLRFCASGSRARAMIYELAKIHHDISICKHSLKNKICQKSKSDECEFYHFLLDDDQVGDGGVKLEMPPVGGDEAVEGEKTPVPTSQDKKGEDDDAIDFDEFPHHYYNCYALQQAYSLDGGVVVPNGAVVRISRNFFFGKTMFHGLGRLFKPLDPDMLPAEADIIVSNNGEIVLSKAELGGAMPPAWNFESTFDDWTIPINFALDGQWNPERVWRPDELRPLTVREKQVARALLSASMVVLQRGSSSADSMMISRQALALLKRHHRSTDQDKLVLQVLMSGPCFADALTSLSGYYKSNRGERIRAEIQTALTSREVSFRALRCRAMMRVVFKTAGYSLLLLTVVGLPHAASKLLEYYDYGFSYNVSRHMVKLMPPQPKPVRFLSKRSHEMKVCNEGELYEDALVNCEEGIISLDSVDDEIEDTARIDTFGTWIEGSPIFIPSSKMQNLKAAVLIRMGASKPTVQKTVQRFLNHVEGVFHDWDLVVQPRDTKAYLRDKYGVKRGDSMYDEWYGVPFDQVYQKCKMFVKREAYVGKFKPRMIWARHQWFVVNEGAWFEALGKSIKGKLAELGHMYTSGETPDKVGQFAQNLERYAYLFEADVSNWDGSLASFFLDIEKTFLETCVDSQPPNYVDYQSYWKDVSGYAYSGDEALRVRLSRCRRSGDLWTSCLNSLINYLLTSFVLSDLSGNPNPAFSMMVMGDDNVVATDEKVQPGAIVSLYQELGMKLEIQQRSTLLDATFCSGLFIPVDGVWRWANMPFRQLAKFGINYNGHNPKNYKALLYGISKGLLCTSGHMPIFGSLLRAICSSAEDLKIKARTDNRHLWAGRIQGGSVMYPAMDTYHWFSHRYNISIETIFSLEEWIECNVTIASMPCKLVGDIFKEGFEVDVGKPCDNTDPTFTFEDLMRWSKEEEILKLQNARRDGITAFQAGWQYGLEERAMGMHPSAPIYHAVFSTISSLSLDTGVALHQFVNMIFWNDASRGNSFLAKKSRGKTTASKPKGGGKKMNTTRKKSRDKAAPWRKAAGNLMRAGGTALGTYLGNPALGSLGGEALAKITGMGDYDIHVNSLMSENISFGDGATTVKDRHFVGHLFSSVDFSTTVFDINPGLATTFPWLSVLARNYERYEIRGLAFEFVSTAGYLTSTQAQGVVVMATQYDPDADVFVNRREMEGYMYTTSGVVTDPQLHLVECDPSQRPIDEMYLRYGETTEERWTDLGRFTIATEGCPDDGVLLGELWVTYHVRLMYPRIEVHGYGNAMSSRISNGSYSSTDPLGVLQTTPIGNLDLTIAATGSGYDTIVFPPLLDRGIYLVTIFFRGTGAAVIHNLDVPEPVNGSLLRVYALDSLGFATSPPSSTYDTTRVSMEFMFQINQKGASVQLMPISGTTFTLPGGPDSVDIVVAQVGNMNPASYENMTYERSLGLRGVTVRHPPDRTEQLALDFSGRGPDGRLTHMHAHQLPSRMVSRPGVKDEFSELEVESKYSDDYDFLDRTSNRGEMAVVPRRKHRG